MHEGDMENSESGELREQDRFLPIANVARIMKKGIPSQGAGVEMHEGDMENSE